ncbi:MAG: hypothetical protein RLO81_14325 [Fulvivirga sp.]|uniref:hypothetical protein n=1 Tax=Fulvivirga sp. TaxID=1931237 RepID=UPI0032EC110E
MATIIRLLLTVTLYVLFIRTEAQEYEPGYIVLNSKDTVFGFVKDRTESRLFEKIKFKNEAGKVKRYSASDILGYKAGINHYESLWYAEESQFFKFSYYNRPEYGEKVFLRVLAKGYLSCYAKEFVHDDNDYPDEFELFLRQGETTMQRATQGIFGLKKKSLSKYFWDCPKLVEKINNLAITNPLDVVTYYNEFCSR